MPHDCGQGIDAKMWLKNRLYRPSCDTTRVDIHRKHHADIHGQRNADTKLHENRRQPRNGNSNRNIHPLDTISSRKRATIKRSKKPYSCSTNNKTYKFYDLPRQPFAVTRHQPNVKIVQMVLIFSNGVEKNSIICF